MRVCVTGGSGFVGAHTTAALLDAGHDVRLLVRDPTRLDASLAPLGLHGVEHVRGDVTDQASVERALAGCDAVFHAAAMVTFDRRRADEVRRVNTDGAGLVLKTASRLGMDPIVYVSSVSTLLPTEAPVLTPDLPVTVAATVYGGTKAGGELLARELQAGGAPIVITYPGGIWGPHDPHLGEQTRAVVNLATMRFVPETSGGFLIVDVRDVAAAHAALFEHGRGPRRYMLGGTWHTGRELADLFTRVTGRRTVSVPVPDAALRTAGRVGDAISLIVGRPLVFTAEGMDTLTWSRPTDDGPARQELGVTMRAVEVTVTDTLRWLRASGRLRDIGKAARVLG